MTKANITLYGEAPSSEARAAMALGNHIGILLNEAARHIRVQVMQEMDALGVSPRWMGVLETLSTQGPVCQQEIGERLGVDRTSMVQLIDRMETAGLVVREVNPGNRRAYLLILTPKGKETLAAGSRIIEETQAQFLSPLSGTEQDELRALLIKLLRGQPRSAPAEKPGRAPSCSGETERSAAGGKAEDKQAK